MREKVCSGFVQPFDIRYPAASGSGCHQELFITDFCKNYSGNNGIFHSFSPFLSLFCRIHRRVRQGCRQGISAQLGRLDISAVFQKPDRAFQHIFSDFTGGFHFLLCITIKQELGKDLSGGFVNGQSSDFVGFGLFQEYNSAQFIGQPLRHVFFARPRG